MVISDVEVEDEDIENEERLFQSGENTNTNYKISEAEINYRRVEYLETQITPLFLSLIKNEDFEFGHISESIKLIQKQLEINRIATQNWFNSLYINYFYSNEKILISLLRVIEFIDPEKLSPTAETMALASLSHKNNEIKEIGVRFFENWSSLTSYNILKNIQVDSVWLQKYINQVITDLEVELCLC